MHEQPTKVKTTSFGVRFPNDILKKVDTDRGKLDRTKHILMIVKNYYEDGGNAATGKRSTPRSRSSHLDRSSEDDQPINPLNQRSDSNQW